MRSVLSHNRQETVDFAKGFAADLPKGTVIAFLGDLGAGKTAFVSGLVEGLGIDCDVSSPTFAICNQYIGDSASLYHFDMYRVTSWDDLYSTGFFDYLESDGVLVIEWSENIEGALPETAVRIVVSPGETEDQRIFEIEGLTL